MADVPSESSREERTEQTSIRRWISSINQTRRMFGHHQAEHVGPEEPPKRISAGMTDEELNEELEELESETDNG